MTTIKYLEGAVPYPEEFAMAYRKRLLDWAKSE